MIRRLVARMFANPKPMLTEWGGPVPELEPDPMDAMIEPPAADLLDGVPAWLAWDLMTPEAKADFAADVARHRAAFNVVAEAERIVRQAVQS
jgi:hypothetical protein